MRNDPIFRIIGSNLSTCPTDCSRKDTRINGKYKYARIFIKRIGYIEDKGGGLAEAVFDNATEEDIDWFVRCKCKKNNNL